MISFFPEVTYDWSVWKLLHECSQYTHYIELTPTLRANVNHFHVSKAVRKYQLCFSCYDLFWLCHICFVDTFI